MTASEANFEPTLFDNPSFRSDLAQSKPAEPAAELASDASESEAPAADGGEEEPVSATAPITDRKRLAEQLDALKRKEAELRRALIIADHPELADAVRAIQGRAYAVARAEEKLATGLSKAEVRKRETLEKKLGSLREKRAELDQQIATLETEHQGLGTDRLTTFQAERKQALEQLLIALGLHEPGLAAIGVDANSLVPEIAGWLPEIEAIARELSAATGGES